MLAFITYHAYLFDHPSVTSACLGGRHRQRRFVVGDSDGPHPHLRGVLVRLDRAVEFHGELRKAVDVGPLPLLRALVIRLHE